MCLFGLNLIDMELFYLNDQVYCPLLSPYDMMSNKNVGCHSSYIHSTSNSITQILDIPHTSILS